MEYPKVLTLGSYQTDLALDGTVVLQEKVDGSNFRFWIDQDGQVHYGSHHQEIHIGEPYGMFKEGVEYLESIRKNILHYPPFTYFFCEYLQKPKHNHLAYRQIPTNHLMLFDSYSNGKWDNSLALAIKASWFGIDHAYQFDCGIADVAKIKSYLDRESYLGGEKIEGVVIKNYGKDILVGGKLRPLFCKYVRPEFKEQTIRRSGEGGLEAFLNSFRSDARWNKAIQALKESGDYTQSPKDIGPLIAQIHKDIEEEEQQTVQEYLWKEFKNQIMRRTTAGFAEWYKEQLVKRLES